MIVYDSPPDGQGRRRLKCLVCGLRFAPTVYPPEQAHHRCIVSVRVGPGTHLVRLIKSLGFSADACDSCGGLAVQMNAWGVEGCREHRAEIVAKLKEAYAALTLAQWLSAAAAAIHSGLAFRMNPLDIEGSLLDVAIERATQAQNQSPPSPAGPAV